MTRSVPAVLVVVCTTAIVAIGAAGSGVLLPSVDPGEGWVRAVRIAGAAGLATGLAGLLVQRWRLGRDERDRQDPTVAALLTAATIMGILALVALLSPVVDLTGNPDRFEAGVGDSVGIESDSAMDAVSRAADARDAAHGFPGMGLARGRTGGGAAHPRTPTDLAEDAAVDRNVLSSRLATLLLVALLVAGALFAVVILRRRMADEAGEGAPTTRGVAAAEAELGLQASLDEVAYDGTDPRRQIAAAYHRLLAALAAAGVPRRLEEAPHEHLHRALGPLGVDPASMHRLAGLFVVAQFGERPVTEHHRAAAAEALEAGLASLRAASPVRGPAAAPSFRETVEP